jgi:hypothetical protein
MASLPASAQFYIGLGAGQSNASLSASDFSTGVAGVDESAKSQDGMGKIMFGYAVSPRWSVEAAYNDLGRPNYSYSIAGLGSAQASLSNSATTLAAVGNIPFAHGWALTGKLGASFNRASVSATASDPTVSNALSLAGSKYNFPTYSTVESTEAMYGLGLEYAFTPSARMRVEYENFGAFGTTLNGNRSSVDAASASLIYSFH